MSDITEAGQSTEPTPDTSLDNTLQRATFTGREPRGFAFTLHAGGVALVSEEELGEQPELTVGDDYELLVERELGDAWGASLRKVEKLAAWDALVAMAKQRASVQGTIVSVGRGGLWVDIGVRAFLPLSHLELHRVEQPRSYLGLVDTFQIIDFDEATCRPVLSRKRALEVARDQSREQVLGELEVGQTREGTVTTVKPYGAFINLGGGIEGLLHVSNMSWGRVDDAHTEVSVGDVVQVVIMEIQPGKKGKRPRIALDRKALLADPWQQATSTLSEGQVVSGEVTRLTDFGAFVQLAPGLEGLVHASELSWSSENTRPEQHLSVGQTIEVQVLGVDAERRRLGLSVKRLQPNPWDDFAGTHEVGQIIEGVVRNVAEFGAFVEVVPGIDGLVHVSNISWSRKPVTAAERFTAGETVSAKILSIDTQAQRLELSVKHLEVDPWDQAEAIARPNTKIEVEIVRLAPFGAFAQIVPDVEGLIHVSEVSEDRVEVRDVLKVGQKVEALVLSFDRQGQRISLSLKRDAIDDAGPDREYSDAATATSTLGEILREQLGLSEPEAAPAAVEVAPIDAAPADAAPADDAPADAPEGTPADEAPGEAPADKPNDAQ